MTVYNIDNEKPSIGFWLLLILGSLALLIVIGLIFYFGFIREKPQFDPVTGCPITEGHVSPRSQTIFLVDETDPLSPIQLDTLRVTLKNTIFKETEPGTLISIYTLSEDEQKNRTPIFEACRIRDGSDADKLTENQTKLQKKFNAFFRNPLNDAITKMAEKTEVAKRSRILESLQIIAINGIQKWAVNGDVRLVIFSDLLHNTPEFSMYQASPSFDKFKISAYAQQVKAPLTGVSVELYSFSNNPKFQTQANINFWRDYFKHSGAMVEKVIPIGK